MSQKSIYLLAIAVAVVLLAGLVIFRPSPKVPVPPAPVDVEPPPAIAVPMTDENAPPKARPSFSRTASDVELPPDEEIERLQEFLDANDNEAIVEQARFLVESEDSRRRSEAMDALVWVSTPEAGMALLPLLGDQDEETSQAALGAMTHILNTISTQIYDDPSTGDLVSADSEEDVGLESEGLQQAYDLWVAACKAVYNADELETLLILLTGLDVKFSVPVLVDVLEGTSGAMKKKAAEYLDIATNGDGVTNREEAALWLMKQAGE